MKKRVLSMIVAVVMMSAAASSSTELVCIPERMCVTGCENYVSFGDFSFSKCFSSYVGRTDIRNGPEAENKFIEALSHAVHLVKIDFWDGAEKDIGIDFSPLGNLPNLKSLTLRKQGLTNLSNLGDLSAFSRLEILDLRVNAITDITGIEKLINLEYLYLSDIGVFEEVDGALDLAPLAGLTKLKHLRISANQYTDFTPLMKLSNLRRLELRFYISGDNHDQQHCWAGLRNLMLALPRCTFINANVLDYGDELYGDNLLITLPTLLCGKCADCAIAGCLKCGKCADCTKPNCLACKDSGEHCRKCCTRKVCMPCNFDCTACRDNGKHCELCCKLAVCLPCERGYSCLVCFDSGDCCAACCLGCGICESVCVVCCVECKPRFNVGKLGHVLGGVTVTTSDALEILKYIVCMENLIEKCDNARTAATIVGGSITTADALEILKHIVGLPSRIAA